MLLLVSAERNKARGAITVHLTSSTNVKVAFNFLNMWMLHPALKDCHLVQGHVAILILSRQSWFKELDSSVSEKVKISLQKWCKEYHLEGKWDKETTSPPCLEGKWIKIRIFVKMIRKPKNTHLKTVHVKVKTVDSIDGGK